MKSLKILLLICFLTSFSVYCAHKETCKAIEEATHLLLVLAQIVEEYTRVHPAEVAHQIKNLPNRAYIDLEKLELFIKEIINLPKNDQIKLLKLMYKGMKSDDLGLLVNIACQRKQYEIVNNNREQSEKIHQELDMLYDISSENVKSTFVKLTKFYIRKTGDKICEIDKIDLLYQYIIYRYIYSQLDEGSKKELKNPEDILKEFSNIELCKD